VVVERDEMAVGVVVAVGVGGQMTRDVVKVRTCLLIRTDQETLGEEIETIGEAGAEDAEEVAEVMTAMTKELHTDLEETGVEAEVVAVIVITTDAMLMTRQHHLEEVEGVIIPEEGEEGMEDVMAMERQVPEEAGAVLGRMGVGKEAEAVAITKEVEHPTVAHLKIAMKSARPESNHQQ
jgi:hypothetical protein